MVVIWGSNYSIVKSALTGVSPIAFNGLRLIIASAVFLILIGSHRLRVGDPAPDPGPRRPHVLRSPNLWLLALVGNTSYQLLFIEALARTSASNSALIIGCTPIFVALLTAALGQEAIGRKRWGGILLSAAGIYLVVGGNAGVRRESLGGDVMMIAAVFCWAAAAIISRPLLRREAPLVVTGWSMVAGSAMYLPFAWSAMRATAWTGLRTEHWLAVSFSALFALCLAYVIWYTAVQRLGNTRTAIYSNMVPVAAMVVAFFGYGEPIGPLKLAGATAILAGVALTRL